MISICIPTYNRLPLLKQCLNSIFNGFRDYPYEVIIADGGSTDGTLEYLRGLDNDNFKRIEQGKLIGATKACNACFKVAKGDYIYLCTDDFIVVPKVLVKACELMDKYPEIGMVSPKIVLERGHLHSVTRWVKRYGAILSLDFIIRASVLREMGYFDEGYYTYFIDSDTSLAVLKLGYTTIVTREVGVFHVHTKASRITDAYLKNRARRLQDVEYGRKKWMTLELKIEEYLHSPSFPPFKLNKSIFFTLCCSVMYDMEWIQHFVRRCNKLATRLYDWLLERTVIFKDKNFDHLEDFFLAQKYPDEIIKEEKE